jgi:hypothetical protein
MNNNALFTVLCYSVHIFLGGRVSIVVLATSYGLDDAGFETWWARNFSHPSRLSLRPTTLPVQWVPDPFPGDKAAKACR